MTTASIGLRQRVGITFLIAGLIAALTPFMNPTAAAAQGPGDWTVNSVELYDSDGKFFDYDGTDVTVPDDFVGTVTVQNADLVVTSGGVTTTLHVSCSEDLTVDPGTITLEFGPEGDTTTETFTITDYLIKSVNPSGASEKLCEPETPLTTIDIVKTVDDGRTDISTDPSFTFTIDCEGANIDPITIVGAGTDSATNIPIGLDCTVTETADGGADATYVDLAADPQDDEENLGDSVTFTSERGGTTVYFHNVFDGPDDPDFEITVNKVVTGNTAPSGAEYTICIEEYYDDYEFDLAEVRLAEVYSDCVDLQAGESHTFEGLWEGAFQVYEVDPEGPEHNTLISVVYTGDGDEVEDLDGVVVDLTTDSPTASVTVTNNYQNETPPNGGPTPVSSSVTVTKVWNVDGAIVSRDFVPEFTVTLGVQPSQTIDAGGTATFTGLTDGASYDLTVVEGALPTADELFGEESGCEFLGSDQSGPDSVTAPGSAEVEVTNFYSCETLVFEEVEEEPEPEVEEETVVLDEVEELPVEAAERATLATTGIPALLLALLGLLGLGLGGGMLATKRERE